MSQLNPRRYQPEEGFSLAGLPLITAAMLAAGVGIGWLASLIGQEMYLVVLFPILMGIGLTVVGAIFGRLAKMRSQRLAAVLGCTSAFVTILSLHYFDYKHFLADRGEFLAQGQRLLGQLPAGVPAAEIEQARRLVQGMEEVDSFGSFLSYAAGVGVSIGPRHGNFGINLGFIGTWIYWVLELVAVAVLATIGLRAGAREPFCSRCDSWKEEQELGKLKKKGFDLAGYVRHGEVQELKAHVAKSGNFILSAAVCPHCETSATIVVKLVQIKENKRGQKEHVELARMTYPGKALPQFERLFRVERDDDDDEEVGVAVAEDEPEADGEPRTATVDDGRAETRSIGRGKVTCPGCTHVLKLARPVPAGKKLMCPSCRTVFVPAREEAKREERVAPAGLAKSKRRPQSARTRAAEIDEDDDEDDREFERTSKNKRRLVLQFFGGIGLIIVVFGAIVVVVQIARNLDQQLPAAEKQNSVVRPRISVEEARKKAKIQRSPPKQPPVIPQP